MGSTGVVAQAPFVAASTALIPVVAPVLLFMTVSSVITVQQALGALSKNLERVRHLMEAEDYARFESAAEQLDEIGSQFEHSQRFTEGMKSGLVLAKRDVTLLRRKFGHLAIREIRSEHDAMVAVSDIDLFVLSGRSALRGAPPGVATQESRTVRKHLQNAARSRSIDDIPTPVAAGSG